MSPDEWLAELQQICVDSDWNAFSRLRTITNQQFASTLDYAGLSSFYDQLLRMSVSEAKFSEVQIDSIEAFQTDVAQAFRIAKSKLQNVPQVKGIYFEYFYDGGDDCLGRVYLCESYSDEDDGWGAEYNSLEAMIDGPVVSQYFNFDHDFEWDDIDRYVAEEYVNGRFLAAVLEEWKASGITGLPFGFANHDHEMVRACANEH